MAKALCEVRGVRRLNNPEYQQRNLLLLLPLTGLAVLTWLLDSRVTPCLDTLTRQALLTFIRTLFPCLFAITVALIVPGRYLIARVSLVTGTYFLSLLMARYFLEDALDNPSICVLAAVTSMLVLPENDDEVLLNRSAQLTDRLMPLVLPFIVLLSLIVVIKQIEAFVLISFNEAFGKSLLSVIFAPLFLVLQALGSQEILNDVATLRYESDMVSPFVNAVSITSLFSLPTVILAKAFFSQGAPRLFLTMLAMVSVMSASVGTCSSLIYILLIIFWPGTFAILIVCSIITYLNSFALSALAFTTIPNLYTPDIDLSQALPFFYSQELLTLEAAAVFMPLIFVALSSLISRDTGTLRHSRHDLVPAGLRPELQNSPDLSTLAFLRALGGLSNLVSVRSEDGALFITIVSPEKLHVASLDALSLSYPEYDRIHRLLALAVGDHSDLIAKKLTALMENEFGEQEHEIVVPESFKIRPMPHVHHSPRIYQG